MGTLFNPHTGERVVLRAEHVFGRNALRADTALEDPAISLMHAVIRWRNGRWMLSDHSRNGTFVDGRVLVPGEPFPLVVGAEVRLGNGPGVVWRVHDVAEPVDSLVPPRFARAGHRAGVAQPSSEQRGAAAVHLPGAPGAVDAGAERRDARPEGRRSRAGGRRGAAPLRRGGAHGRHPGRGDRPGARGAVAGHAPQPGRGARLPGGQGRLGPGPISASAPTTTAWPRWRAGAWPTRIAAWSPARRAGWAAPSCRACWAWRRRTSTSRSSGRANS